MAPGARFAQCVSLPRGSAALCPTRSATPAKPRASYRLSWGQDEAKVAVIERIAQIGRLALEREEDALDATGAIHALRKPDHRTALASAKHLADILGLSGANSEVVVRYQQMTDSELWLEAQSFVAQLQGKPDGRSEQTQDYETSGEAVPEPARSPFRDDAEE